MQADFDYAREFLGVSWPEKKPVDVIANALGNSTETAPDDGHTRCHRLIYRERACL